MEGSEALRKSREALNQAMLRRLYRMIDQEMDKPSEKFKDWLSSLPVELVRADKSVFKPFHQVSSTAVTSGNKCYTLLQVLTIK